jgi:hypothetical protein
MTREQKIVDIDELNKREAEEYQVYTKWWEEQANRCVCCKSKFELKQTTCYTCGANLPAYEVELAPPFKWRKKGTW